MALLSALVMLSASVRVTDSEICTSSDSIASKVWFNVSLSVDLLVVGSLLCLNLLMVLDGSYCTSAACEWWVWLPVSLL